MSTKDPKPLSSPAVGVSEASDAEGEPDAELDVTAAPARDETADEKRASTREPQVEAGPQDTPIVRKLGRRAGALVLELLVVFAGVYCAFLLDRFQEGQRDAARRLAIYQALKIDVEQTKEYIEWHREWLETKYLEPIVRPYERGEQPAIFGLWLPSPSQSDTWPAMAQVGVDLLDPAFIQEVEAHRATIQFMLDQADRAVQLSDARIEPLLGEHDFYDEGGKLRENHRWYPRLLGYLAGNAERAAASTQRLEADLQRRLEGG